MAKWKNMIYTDAGRNIIARASSGECQVEFTRAVIGDGTYTEEEKQEQDLKTKTQLKSERNSYGFSEISSKDSTVYLKVALQNDGVLSAYFIHEIGVYVKEKGSDGDEVLALIAVADVPDYFPDNSNSITILQTIAIDFDDAKMLSIRDNMGAYALANPEYTIPDKEEILVSGENLSDALGKIAKVVNDLITCPPLIKSENVEYDNTESGLSAENVHGAIDEVNNNFNNLEIGGRNLLVGTKDFSGGKWVKNEYYETVSETYKGLTVKKTMLEWAGISQNIEVDEGYIYTLSAYVKSSYSKVWAFTQHEGSAKSNPNSKLFTVVPDTWQRLSITFEATTSGTLRPRFENPEKGEIMYVCGLKLENGNKPTPWTPAIEDTEAEIQEVGNQVTTNLLKPTLATTTQNGVTCTNNGDGTYTLNGKATANTNFNLLNNFDFSGKLKLVGCPNGGSLSTYRVCYTSIVDNVYNDIGDGIIIENFSSETYPNAKFILFVTSGATLNNLLFKPMITTNLNATYDDFVPYTGSTGKLNSDVADLSKNKMDKNNPTGTGSFSMNRKSGTNVGEYSSAIGNNCTASGNNSHAEGNSSTARGDSSHAENASDASGICSHAEGTSTASGICSHAEGNQTTASGSQSHSSGYQTIAGYASQAVFGNFNDNKSTSLFEVGNGTDNDNRSNALELSENGDLTISGNLVCSNKAEYEDGTWTPTNVIGSSEIDTSVYEFRYSEYKKIGKVVILTTTAISTNYETKSAELVIRSTSLPFSYSHIVLAFAINASGVSSIGTFNAYGGAFKFDTYTFTGASSGLTDVHVTIIYTIN